MTEFHRAVAAFSPHKLIIRAREPTAGFPDIMGLTAAPQGEIWVDLTRLDEIESVIEEEGLALSLEPRPIVDRAEPICPHCEAELDAENERERCPTCGGAFAWIEIDQPQLSHHETNCRTCGYDLRGLPGTVCPECGTKHEPSADAIVRAASGDANDPPAPIDLDARIRRNTITAALIVAATALVLLIHLLQSND